MRLLLFGKPVSPVSLHHKHQLSSHKGSGKGTMSQKLQSYDVNVGNFYFTINSSLIRLRYSQLVTYYGRMSEWEHH